MLVFVAGQECDTLAPASLHGASLQAGILAGPAALASMHGQGPNQTSASLQRGPHEGYVQTGATLWLAGM